MKLTEQRRIIGEKDNATVSLNESGSLYVGAITITRAEATDYPVLLAKAIKQVLALPVTGTPDNN